MKKLHWFACVALLTSACTHSAKNSTVTTTPSPSPAIRSADILTTAKPSELEFELFRRLAANPKNVSFSPLSLKIDFSLIYPGTAGSTQKLYSKLFGFTDDQPNPMSSEYLLAQKTSALKSGDQQLVIENSAWVHNPKTINESFKESLKIQSAEMFKLKLETMNQWVSKATHGKINKLFEKLSDNTKAIFINVIYFKQKWADPFDETKTTVATFQASPNLTENVRTMHLESKMGYYEDTTSKWIELKYENSPFVMWFALPLKGYHLDAVLTQLNSSYLNTIGEKLSPSSVTLALPKFKISEKESFKNLFTDLGHEELFTTADYSRIQSAPKFVISDVIQATAIEVNEKGTEVAAATGAVMLEGLAREPLLSKSFLADQPFLCILRNSETKEIYWMGKIFDPLALK